MLQTRKKRWLAGLFAMLLIAGASYVAFGPVAAAQDEEPPAGEKAKPEGQEAADAKPPEGLGDKFDKFIGNINGFIASALFWSVTGDLFKKTELSDVRGVTHFAAAGGDKVGDRTGAITEIPGSAVRVNEDGIFVDDQGRRVVLMAPDGRPLLVAAKDNLIVNPAGQDPGIVNAKGEAIRGVFVEGNAHEAKDGNKAGDALSLLTPQNAVALNLPGRSDFVNFEGKAIYRLDPDGKTVHKLDKFARPIEGKKGIPGDLVRPNDRGIFVDGQGRPIVVIDVRGQPLVLADASGALVDPSGKPLEVKNSEGQVIEVRFKAGNVVDGKHNPVNILTGKNEYLEGGLLQVHKVTALQQKKSGIGIPFLIVVLVAGSIFFTFWYRWINVRGFKHCIDVISGKYDRPEDQGEISHFRALTSALSATVGLGNIAGVAIAIQMGGPGAVFWMWCAAVFGMTAKFSSCTLSQLYRQVNKDGSISGGPMYYIDMGLKAKGPGWGVLGKILAVMFAFMIMGGALGGGNMFQANQSFKAFSSVFGIPHAGRYAFGLIMAVVVGIVILGGIKRIGAATSRIVPFMCSLYVLASLFVIFVNIDQVPQTFSLIFSMAFAKNAFLGGMFGVLVIGVQRAAFSNEAGLGSAAIAHAAAKTDEPVREGIVAMIGPFIDTIIVCTMTALVVIITGMWANPEVGAGAANPGVALTVAAFQVGIAEWFSWILAICIVLFAYSTMISWCYYGERGWMYLLDHLGEGAGLRSVVIFRVVFVSCVFVGAVASLGSVLDFSDLMILCMAFPNIIGSVILAPHVLRKVRDYWNRYTTGVMKPVR